MHIGWIRRANRPWQIHCLAHIEKAFAKGAHDYSVAAIFASDKTLLSCDLIRQWLNSKRIDGATG